MPRSPLTLMFMFLALAVVIALADKREKQEAANASPIIAIDPEVAPL